MCTEDVVLFVQSFVIIVIIIISVCINKIVFYDLFFLCSQK